MTKRRKRHTPEKFCTLAGRTQTIDPLDRQVTSTYNPDGIRVRKTT